MANYRTLSSLFSAIAETIRAKLGTNDSIVATDFPDMIMSIPTSAEEPEFTDSILVTRGANIGSAPSSVVVDFYIGYPWTINGQYKTKWTKLDIGDSVSIPVPEQDSYVDSQWAQPSGTSYQNLFRQSPLCEIRLISNSRTYFPYIDASSAFPIYICNHTSMDVSPAGDNHLYSGVTGTLNRVVFQSGTTSWTAQVGLTT